MPCLVQIKVHSRAWHMLKTSQEGQYTIPKLDSRKLYAESQTWNTVNRTHSRAHHQAGKGHTLVRLGRRGGMSNTSLPGNLAEFEEW